MRIVRKMDGARAGARCDDARCGCGSLLARVVDGEVELKCRRCKATWRLSLDGGAAGERDGDPPRGASAPRRDRA